MNDVWVDDKQSELTIFFIYLILFKQKLKHTCVYFRLRCLPRFFLRLHFRHGMFYERHWRRRTVFERRELTSGRRGRRTTSLFCRFLLSDVAKVFFSLFVTSSSFLMMLQLSSPVVAYCSENQSLYLPFRWDGIIRKV